MYIDEEKLGSYNAYVADLAKRIGTFQLDPNDLVWHYTSGSALVAIIDTQEIYATHVSCLNDSMEMRYAASLFRDSLSREALNHSADSDEHRFLTLAAEFFNEEPLIPNHVHYPYVVSCFTSLKDDLSQWRAYGGGENGFAIGFRVGELQGLANSIVGRVSYYEAAKHDRYIQELVGKTLEFYMEGANDNPRRRHRLLD